MSSVILTASNCPPVIGSAIISGMDIVSLGNLNLVIKAGSFKSSLGSTVQTSDISVVLPNNTSRVWVWVSTWKSVTLIPNLTVPSQSSYWICVGSAVTSNGNITSLDSSGVFYVRGNDMGRMTTDTSTPTDNPPSTVQFYNWTVGGAVYLWDGTGYSCISGGTAAFGSTVVSSMTVSNGHLVFSGTAPSVASGAAVGTGASASSLSSNANDGCGVLTIPTGTSATTGILATVTFAASHSSTPTVIVTPANAVSAACTPYATATSTGFTISASVAATSSSTFIFNYVVLN